MNRAFLAPGARCVLGGMGRVGGGTASTAVSPGKDIEGWG